MDELLAYAILLYEDIVTAEEYQKRLDALFLAHPDDRMLLDLECETDIQKAVIYIRTKADYGYLGLHPETFGRVLIKKLKEYYIRCPDIQTFGSKMYCLWESLPGNIQNQEPFWTLYRADDPLFWGDDDPFSCVDEARVRTTYEKMLEYYD